MAQTVYVENNVLLDSWEEIQRWVGLLEPGVYRGFDSYSFNGTTVTLSHTQTGIEKTNKTGDGKSNKTAIILTPQGSVIHEDAAVELVVSTNSGGANDRIDYVVGTHTYQNSSIGVDMVFSILQGPGDGSEPVVSDVYNDVIIGKLIIPAGATDHTSTQYIRESRPGLANEDVSVVSSNGTIGVVSTEGQRDVSIESPLLAITDFDNAQTPGLFRLHLTSSPAPANAPSLSYPERGAFLVTSGEGFITQTLIRSSGEIWTRRKDDGTLWSGWTRTVSQTILDIEKARIDSLESSMALLNGYHLLDRTSAQTALTSDVDVPNGQVTGKNDAADIELGTIAILGYGVHKVILTGMSREKVIANIQDSGAYIGKELLVVIQGGVSFGLTYRSTGIYDDDPNESPAIAGYAFNIDTYKIDIADSDQYYLNSGVGRVVIDFPDPVAPRDYYLTFKFDGTYWIFTELNRVGFSYV